MGNIYKAYNGPMPTTAAQAAVTTGTAIKTLLQIAAPSGTGLYVVAWGISFDGAAAAAGIKCELLTTGTVAATVTAHTSTGLLIVGGNGGSVASKATLGTSATGYTGSAEGTITATRVLDHAMVQPTGERAMLRPLGQEWSVAPSDFLRVRVTAAAAVNAVCWVEWTEG